MDGGAGMETVEHEQRRLRLVDVPTKPLRKALLVFVILTFIGILAIASVLAIYSDVKTDGYDYHAHQQTPRFS
jgi:hypothetical protein